MAVIESVRYCSRQVVINDTSCQPAASIEAWINGLCILRGATLLGADDSSLSLNNSFSVGDTVELRGSYEGATFNASIIIKEST